MSSVFLGECVTHKATIYLRTALMKPKLVDRQVRSVLWVMVSKAPDTYRKIITVGISLNRDMCVSFFNRTVGQFKLSVQLCRDYKVFARSL